MAGRIWLDGDGQPVVTGFCAGIREDRTVDELIGIAKGLVADGRINEAEADFLRLWLERNACHALDVWPVNVIDARVQKMLSDGVIDAQERKELFELLSQLVGGTKPVLETVASFSTALPVDIPQPDIMFPGKGFCLTGTFAFGPRSSCQGEIVKRGGIILPGVSGKLDYLVVGIVGSRDWAHSTHGRKIEKAMELRDAGKKLSIVSEDHWANYLAG